jgi:hypothetical protein
MHLPTLEQVVENERTIAPAKKAIGMLKWLLQKH